MEPYHSRKGVGQALPSSDSRNSGLAAGNAAAVIRGGRLFGMLASFGFGLSNVACNSELRMRLDRAGGIPSARIVYDTVGNANSEKLSQGAQPFVGLIGGWAFNIWMEDEGRAGVLFASYSSAQEVDIVDRPDWDKLISHIDEAHRRGAPIVISAHSMGNNHVVEFLAPALQKMGIAIDVFAMCDPSYLDPLYPFRPIGDGKIPANVRHVICANSAYGWWQGRPLTAADLADPSQTTFENVGELVQSHMDYTQPVAMAKLAAKVRRALAAAIASKTGAPPYEPERSG